MKQKIKITFFGWLYFAILVITIIILLHNNLSPLPLPPNDFKGTMTQFDATTTRDYKNILVPFGAIIVSVGVAFIHVLYGYYQQIIAKSNQK
jgi:uncharacterized membrane protein